MGMIYSKTECVYLIKNEENYYKIGRTGNIRARIKQLQTGYPLEITLIHQFKTNFSREIEYVLHKDYYGSKIRGEWFSLTQEEVDNFLKHCKKTEKNLIYLKENRLT